MLRQAMQRIYGTLLALISLSACKESYHETTEPPSPATAQSASDIPVQITVTGTRSDLIFSFREGNRFKTANKIDKIPEAARGQVIVTDLSLTPAQRQAGKYIYLADLRQARANGEYPVSIASRYGLEAKLSGTHSASVSATVRGEAVILYSTAWCGVCKKAKRLLDRWGVAYTEKDIEGSRKAKRELTSKAQAAGIQPGGVPVIDVAGTLLQGLDETSLKATLQSKGFL